MWHVISPGGRINRWQFAAEFVICATHLIMRQFLTIAANAFMELIRQPVFLLLMTASVLFEIFLAVPYYFAFGDEPKLVKNSALAVMLLSGLFGAVLSASASLAREIRTGTALAVLSKPVGRAQFLLAKYAGLAAALTVLTYVNLIGVLLASWMAFDAYGKTDLAALGIFAAGGGAGLRAGGLQQFFSAAAVRERRGAGAGGAGDAGGVCDFSVHPADAEPGRAGAGGLAAGAGGNFDFVRVVDSGGAGAGVFDAAGHDSHAGGLLGVFFDRADVGLFFWQAGGNRGGGPWWASALYTVIPNWQLFWLADALSMGKSTFHWAYVGKAFVYAVAYAGAALAVGTALFEERELG